MPPRAQLDTTAAALRRDVVALAGDQGRMVGTAGHQAAAELLVAWLSRLGLAAYCGNSYRLDYAAGSMAGVNIAATLPGHSRERPPLVLAAHYDSVMAAPCADDNAAAVAICLQVVARLAPQPLLRDLVLIFFDAEEPPFTGTDAMGSIHFYRHQMDRRGVHALVVQDLTGHDVSLPVGGKEIRAPLLRDLVFMTGVESHPHLHQVVASSPLPRRQRLLSPPTATSVTSATTSCSAAKACRTCFSPAAGGAITIA